MSAAVEGSPPVSESALRDGQGWDGKLRLDRRAVITNPEALSDPDYTDEEAPPVEKVEADEGTSSISLLVPRLTFHHQRSA